MPTSPFLLLPYPWGAPTAPIITEQRRVEGEPGFEGPAPKQVGGQECGGGKRQSSLGGSRDGQQTDR